MNLAEPQVAEPKSNSQANPDTQGPAAAGFVSAHLAVASDAATSASKGVDAPTARPAQASTTTATEPCCHARHQLDSLFPARDFITHHDFTVALCSKCGLAVTSPQPAPDKIASYYPSGYYGALSERRFPKIVETMQQTLYGHRVAAVERAVGGTPGRVLDVGCGRGVLLNEFRRRGWDVQGTELSEESSNHARNGLKIPVKIGDLESIHFPANHFDAITIWHVLEHVSNPTAILAEINRILKPGGVLLIGVPNFGSYEARWFKDKWFHLDVPRHVTHFTQSMLRNALQQTGFIERLWSSFAPEYDAFSFVQSSLNKCGLRHNLLYDFLRGKRAKVIAKGQAPSWQLPATFILGAVFGLISLPMIVWAGLSGQGGTMTVISVKQSGAPAPAKSLWQSLLAFLPGRWART